MYVIRGLDQLTFLKDIILCGPDFISYLESKRKVSLVGLTLVREGLEVRVGSSQRDLKQQQHSSVGFAEANSHIKEKAMCWVLVVSPSRQTALVLKQQRTEIFQQPVGSEVDPSL